MNLKKTGLIAAIVVFALVVIFILLRGVSVNRVDKKSREQQELQQQMQQMQQQQNTGSLKVDPSVMNENTGTQSVGDALSNKENANTGSSTPEEAISLQRVSSVNLIAEETQDVLVSSKDVYVSDSGVYAYSLSMILPVQGTYRVVNYLCSVKTWNSLEAGQSISVTYGIDANQNVLIEALATK